MTLERSIARSFALDDETWRRHANPWSVATRNTVLPILILAFWSRAWLGWYALFPVALALFWTWYNSRIFPAPRSFDSWAAKAVFGERFWLNRDIVPVPEHHRTVPSILSAVAGAGMLLVVWGVYSFDPWPTLLGTTLVYCAKLWFLDRMAWLCEDLLETDEYRTWIGNAGGPF